MSEALLRLLAGLAGLALGVVFFGGLWWTVLKAASSGHPARWFLGSALLRGAIVLPGFFLLSGGHWQRLVGALVGFIVARLGVIWLTRPMPETAGQARREASHAP